MLELLRNTCKFLVVSFLFLLIFSFIAQLGYVTGQTDSLNAANEAVNQAYNTLSAAEKAGADVTSLVVQFNKATGFLSEAENSYRNDNASIASSKASEAVFIARQVNAEAQNVLDQVKNSALIGFWLTLGLLIVGLFVLVVVLFLVWRFIKRRFIIKAFINKDSEVVKNET